MDHGSIDGPGSADIMQTSPGIGLVLGLRPVDQRARVIGTASTCQCPPADNLPLHRALAAARPGDILVCDAGGRLDAGYFGELMATDARNRGIRGLVISGSVRDTQRIRELGFPVFAVGTNPTTCHKVDPGQIGRPVEIGGVRISQGDTVVADADGICIIPAVAAASAIESAARVASRESDIKARLQSERLWRILGIELD